MVRACGALFSTLLLPLSLSLFIRNLQFAKNNESASDGCVFLSVLCALLCVFCLILFRLCYVVGVSCCFLR